MFNKFNAEKDVSSRKVLKSSAQRAIYRNILQLYPNISGEQLEAILPKKEQLSMVKCMDHVCFLTSGSSDEPLFFNQRDGPYYMTLKLLHRLGDVMVTVYTDQGAISPLLNGADLMCAGVKKDDLADFPEGSPVCVVALGKTLPFAIGTAKMSSQELKKAKSGIGIEIIHRLGDGLWLTSEL